MCSAAEVDDLSSPEGMRRLRSALIRDFEWFFHISEADVFEDIQAKGLRRHLPNGTPAADAALLANVPDANEGFICLTPLQPATIKFGKAARRFIVALHRRDIPHRLGLDWSFGGLQQAVMRYQVFWPRGTATEIIAASVCREWQCVLAFDPIPAACLRVCPAGGQPQDVASWPPLVGRSINDVRVFDGEVAYDPSWPQFHGMAARWPHLPCNDCQVTFDARDPAQLQAHANHNVNPIGCQVPHPSD